MNQMLELAIVFFGLFCLTRAGKSLTEAHVEPNWRRWAIWIGWLLFGGFVKIAGTDTGKDVDPYTIEDGFFGKGAWARIKVALMGPLVNLLFAIVAFSLLWTLGGREKNF